MTWNTAAIVGAVVLLLDYLIVSWRVRVILERVERLEKELRHALRRR